MNQLALDLVLALVGAAVYVFASNGKLAELGKWLYVVALLWLVYAVSGRVVHF